MATNLNQMFGLEPNEEEQEAARSESYANGWQAGVIAVNELTKRFSEVYGKDADPDLMRGIFDAIRAEI